MLKTKKKQRQEYVQRVRAKDCKGRFVGDDPSTPDVDEAWTVKKKDTKVSAKRKLKEKGKKRKTSEHIPRRFITYKKFEGCELKTYRCATKCFNNWVAQLKV